MMICLISVLLMTGSFTGAESQSVFDNPNFSFDKMLDMTVSALIGQKSEDSSLTPKHYETFLMNDNTNEDIARYSAQEIIARSGYDYENHYVESDDGYITNVIRILNPLADKSKLKWPPVMMMHGGITDNTIWIWSSAIQHHPERYPRLPDDGPITSWNKSLAFTLANNGYDVWLVGTRGSNIENKRHKHLENHYNWFDHLDLVKSKIKADLDFKLNFKENYQYWNFTMEDISQFEVPRQQEKIMQLTGSDKVTLIDVSFSTLINYGVMSENPQFVSRLHNYVSVAPILNNRGTNLAIRFFQETLCTRIPLPVGIILYQVILSQASRDFTSLLSKFKQLRYSLVKTITRVIAGPSARFECNLDPGFSSHIFQSTGYKQLRHYCQQVIAGQPQRYDYGRWQNLRLYGMPKPPKYDLSKIEHPDWMLISGGNDKLATVASVKQLLKSVKRKPNKHIHIKRYNHADLIAGVEIDKYINLPVLRFLEQFAVIPGGSLDDDNHDGSQSVARGLNSSISSPGGLAKLNPIEESSEASTAVEGHLWGKPASLAFNQTLTST